MTLKCDFEATSQVSKKGKNQAYLAQNTTVPWGINIKIYPRMVLNNLSWVFMHHFLIYSFHPNDGGIHSFCYPEEPKETQRSQAAHLRSQNKLVGVQGGRNQSSHSKHSALSVL